MSKKIQVDGKNIISGTVNHIKQRIGLEEPTQLQITKYNICKGCEYAVKSQAFAHILDSVFTDIQGKKCSRCGCSLVLKKKSKRKCPKNKW